MTTTGRHRTVIIAYDSPLGPMTLAATLGPERPAGALSGCWFDGQRHDRAGLPDDCRTLSLPGIEAGPGETPPVLVEAADWLDTYFAGGDPGPRPALALRGTSFQQLVWDELLAISAGRTRTYGELAHAIEARTGRACAARAVGGAVGRNPVSVIVPCHRVVGADGSITGYAGGSERKSCLLRLEGAERPGAPA